MALKDYILRVIIQSKRSASNIMKGNNMKLNFAENFKHLRKENGITQEKLADILGVSSQSVSRWELSICYPDLEMLPSIANYFGVTVDSLLSNDINSKEKDREIFEETIDTLSDDTTECIDFVMEYCRKYPQNDYYSYQLIYAIKRYAVGDRAKTEKYMPCLLENVQRLLETQYRNASIQLMVMLCDENELNKWLNMTPYNGSFSRRNCLISRAVASKEWEIGYIQQGLKMLETLAVQLDSRCPDSFGPHNKALFQMKILDIIRSLGEENGVPDGWKQFYAYKQLVLSACFFACGETEKAWENFDLAIEKSKYIFSLKNQWLNIGGAFFSNIKVDKMWNYAIDENGEKHKLFGIVNYSFGDMKAIDDLLTNPKWAWFDSVRQTPKYIQAVEWVKTAQEKMLTR